MAATGLPGDDVFTSRRVFIGSTLGSLALAGLPSIARAADFPTRPIRMIVPFGPGTTTDNVTRVVAAAMGRSLNQTLVVDNRSGGGGTIGTDMTAKAPADGYTLVMGTVGTHAINKSLFRKLTYDPVRDFARSLSWGRRRRCSW